jgi:hypothetical protein
MAEKELADEGYEGQNAILSSQKSAFMTTAFCDRWATAAFFPTIDQGRMWPSHHGKATLLMDTLRSHHSQKLLAQAGPAPEITS